MNRAPRRFTAQQALLALQDIDDAESGSDSGSDDNDSVQSSETRYQLNSDDSGLEPDNSEDEYSDNDTVYDLPDAVGGDNSVSSRDGTRWKILLQDTEDPGRLQQQNVFTAKSGITGYCRLVTTPLEAFKLPVTRYLFLHSAQNSKPIFSS